ncbi:MAG: glycosyltransferase [Ignavibacteria bacterium]|nr:glycosyltransferase [Ignavibacteria bacterium]MBK9404253.1 glycosyltransferase [Ignavibacteria bacterium]MBL0109144.1 glycosyltransferase [Ignavibacteria bacterium]
MKFSVIITTLNRADSIFMCLDSLVCQDYPKEKYEILIVNNNSTDNTEEVVEDYIRKYPEVNIRYYYVPKPGQVYARQIGILASKNEILTFTDDDGILVKNWLKEIANVFEKNENAAGVAGKIEIKWDKTPPEWIHDYEEQLGKLNYGDEIKYEIGLYMNAGNLSIKKDVLIDVGGFNPEMVGDWLLGDGETGLWLRLKKNNYLIGWAPKALMYHYQLADKNATVKDIKRRFMNNGICIPYNIYAINKEGTKALVKNMLYTFKQGIRWNIKKLKYTLAGNMKSRYYALFRTAFYFAQVKYSWKIITDKEFRNSLTKNDWLVKVNSKGALV